MVKGMIIRYKLIGRVKVKKEGYPLYSIGFKFVFSQNLFIRIILNNIDDGVYVNTILLNLRQDLFLCRSNKCF